MKNWKEQRQTAHSAGCTYQSPSLKCPPSPFLLGKIFTHCSTGLKWRGFINKQTEIQGIYIFFSRGKFSQGWKSGSEWLIPCSPDKNFRPIKRPVRSLVPVWGCRSTWRQECDAILKNRKRFSWNGKRTRTWGWRSTGWSGKRSVFNFFQEQSQKRTDKSGRNWKTITECLSTHSL